jgi:cyanosortase A-associated protein
MLIPVWKSVRILLLAASFGGLLVALAKVAMAPKPPSKEASAPNLAESVPLPGWQLLESKAQEPEEEGLRIRLYSYRRGTTPLDVDLRYTDSDGDVQRFLFVYTPVRGASNNLQVRQHPQTGSYGVVTHSDRAYLTACINPRGSTATKEQFRQSYSQDLQLGRLTPWLMGQQPLIDRRCLWTVMSTPLKPDATGQSISPEVAYKTLEEAWVPWYQWWQANYPPLVQ